MKSPGTLLREARESKGLTLAEVAAMTRIPRTLLSHLEQDRFEEMRGDVFVRGHLRSYARELGLDSEALIRGYERASGVIAPPVSSELSRPTVSRAAVVKAAAARPVVQERVAKPASTKTQATAAPTWMASITATHMFAVALVATAVVLFVSLLSGSRATAKDPAQFPQSNAQAWELEQDVQETRWLLEQPQGQTN